MPHNQMDEKKLGQYKEDLMHLKEKVLHDIKNMDTNNSVNGTGAPENAVGHGMHMADAASDMYDREFSLNLASNDRELVQKIDEALSRLEKGLFGKCVHCGNGIPVARLKAIPYVDTCLKCQEAAEAKANRV